MAMKYKTGIIWLIHGTVNTVTFDAEFQPSVGDLVECWDGLERAITEVDNDLQILKLNEATIPLCQ